MSGTKSERDMSLEQVVPLDRLKSGPPGELRVVQKEKMQILTKIIICLIVIVAATVIGKRLPSAAAFK